MTHKIKVFLTFMVLGASFSVFTFFKSIDVRVPALKELKSSVLSAIDNDRDDDGLDNTEESYWNTDFQNPDTDGDGFLDGEEIASGHDPLIPGPEDFLPTDANLTKKLSSLALSGLYEGSLKNDSDDYEDYLNTLALVVIDDAENSFNFNTENANIRLSGSDRQSQQLYINRFSETYGRLIETFVLQMMDLESNLNKIGAKGFGDKSVSESFKNKSYDYKKIMNELSSMAVPQVWGKSHLGVIKFTGSLLSVNESIALKGEEDPVKATLALNKLIELWDILPGMTESYSQKIREAGLSTQNTIFK